MEGDFCLLVPTLRDALSPTPSSNRLVTDWLECDLSCFGAQPVPLAVCFIDVYDARIVSRPDFFSLFRGQAPCGSSRDANDLRKMKLH